MNWSRYKLLIISGVICLLLSGGALFWLLKNRGENQKLDRDIRSLGSQVTRLESEAVFPSQACVDALEGEQESVRKLRDSIVSEIEGGQLEPRKMIRSRFGDFVRGEFVPGLQKAAKASTKGGEDGVLLKDPSFGLSSYLEEGALPDADEIAALMLELDVMKHVATTLFDGGISELVLFEIEHAGDEKESGANGGGLPGAFPGTPGAFPGALPGAGLPGSPGANPAAQEGAESGDTDWIAERDRLFEPMHLTLQFKVYEDFLFGLLNAFLADSNQFVITGIQVTNDNQDLWPASITTAFGPEKNQGRGPMGGPAGRPRAPRPRGGIEAMLAMMEGDAGGEAEVVDTSIPVAGLKDRRKLDVGGEMLNVQLDLTLYRLKPQAEAATTSEGI